MPQCSVHSESFSDGEVQMHALLSTCIVYRDKNVQSCHAMITYFQQGISQVNSVEQGKYPGNVLRSKSKSLSNIGTFIELCIYMHAEHFLQNVFVHTDIPSYMLKFYCSKTDF